MNAREWVELGNGASAASMGDGTFVVCQPDEKGDVQSVCLDKADLEALLERC